MTAGRFLALALAVPLTGLLLVAEAGVPTWSPPSYTRNPYTGNNVVKGGGYNPTTGRGYSYNQQYNPYTGAHASKGAAYNNFNGNFAARGAYANPWTGVSARANVRRR